MGWFRAYRDGDKWRVESKDEPITDMPLFKNVHGWFYGLLSGVIGGATAAVSSGFGSMILDAKDFNLGEGLGKTLKLMGITAILGAISHAVAYLMRSPLPPRGDDTDFIPKP